MTGTGTQTQTWTTGVTTIALLVLRTGELKTLRSKKKKKHNFKHDVEFKFNDVSTHEGHLYQNGILSWSFERGQNGHIPKYIFVCRPCDFNIMPLGIYMYFQNLGTQTKVGDHVLVNFKL